MMMYNMKAKMLGVVTLILLGTAGAWAASDNHGAIAYNFKNERYGWSVDYPTQSGANTRALNECGKGCEVVVEFWNTCAAIATGTEAYGWSYRAQTLDEVEDAALRACNKLSKTRDCAIVQSACTTRMVDEE